LMELLGRVGHEFGFARIQLLRPVGRRDAGLAADWNDWLKW
jgi:hypothetical protein